MGKTKLILLRHGASLWNEKNIFTGWVDIPLSSKGIEESFQAGKKLLLSPSMSFLPPLSSGLR